MDREDPVSLAAVSRAVLARLRVRPDEELRPIGGPHPLVSPAGTKYVVNMNRAVAGMAVYFLRPEYVGEYGGVYEPRIRAVVSAAGDVFEVGGDTDGIASHTPLRPEIRPEDALGAALRLTRLSSPRAKDASRFRPPGDNPELVVYQAPDGGRSGVAWCCYVVGDSTEHPETNHAVFIDAITGAYLGSMGVGMSC